MKKRSRKKYILIGLLILVVAAQALQPSKNDGNPTGPNDIMKAVQVPDSIYSLLKVSCYDCHSNHTVYPWYNHITPVNWWLANHINEGKRELNFTIFGEYQKKRKLKKLDEIAKTIQKDDMPLSSYLIIHHDAKLNEAQKKLLIDWANGAKDEVNRQP